MNGTRPVYKLREQVCAGDWERGQLVDGRKMSMKGSVEEGKRDIYRAINLIL